MIDTAKAGADERRWRGLQRGAGGGRTKLARAARASVAPQQHTPTQRCAHPAKGGFACVGVAAGGGGGRSAWRRGRGRKKASAPPCTPTLTRGNGCGGARRGKVGWSVRHECTGEEGGRCSRCVPAIGMHYAPPLLCLGARQGDWAGQCRRRARGRPRRQSFGEIASPGVNRDGPCGCGGGRAVARRGFPRCSWGVCATPCRYVGCALSIHGSHASKQIWTAACPAHKPQAAPSTDSGSRRWVRPPALFSSGNHGRSPCLRGSVPQLARCKQRPPRILDARPMTLFSIIMARTHVQVCRYLHTYSSPGWMSLAPLEAELCPFQKNNRRNKPRTEHKQWWWWAAQGQKRTFERNTAAATPLHPNDPRVVATRYVPGAACQPVG